MEFNSLDYILFLIVSIFTLRNIRNDKFFRIALTLLSWFFYSLLSIKLLTLIVLFTVFCWLVSSLLFSRPDLKKQILIFGIVIILLQLFIFKYIGWLSQIVSDIYDLDAVLKIILPIGISFYSFQAIAYLVDLSKNRKLFITDFWNFSAFLTFFPQLVAGPIERSSDLAPQLLSRKFVSTRMVNTGLLLIITGLSKKILLADNLGGLVQYTDSNLIQPGFGFLLLLAFSFQIYFDFSAYTDIARGSARILGINLRTNFRQPYISNSPQEFWRRWHVSLSEWIKDYIYKPLRRRGFKYSTAVFIALTLSGLWHGAGFGFVAWGIWNAFLLIMYTKVKKPILKNDEYSFFQNLILFALVLFGWSFFYSTSILHFFQIHHSILRPLIYLQPLTIEFYKMIVYIVVLISPVMYFEIISRGKFSLSDFISLRVKLSAPLILFIYILVQAFYRRSGNEFIYFQF
jgi:alginate O-acetyltransferase complex protein AlgI